MDETSMGWVLNVYVLACGCDALGEFLVPIELVDASPQPMVHKGRFKIVDDFITLIDRELIVSYCEVVSPRTVPNRPYGLAGFQDSKSL